MGKGTVSTPGGYAQSLEGGEQWESFLMTLTKLVRGGIHRCLSRAETQQINA